MKLKYVKSNFNVGNLDQPYLSRTPKYNNKMTEKYLLQIMGDDISVLLFNSCEVIS